MRGEQNLTYKKAGQLRGGGFVNHQDPGEAFHVKITDNGLNTHDQSSQDEYYTSGGAIFHPDLEDLEESFQFKPPAQNPPETAFQKSAYRYDRDFQPPAPSPPETALSKTTIDITGKKRHRQDDCSKMVNSGNRRSDMVTHDNEETAARNYKDSTEPTFHW